MYIAKWWTYYIPVLKSFYEGDILKDTYTCTYVSTYDISHVKHHGIVYMYMTLVYGTHDTCICIYACKYIHPEINWEKEILSAG